MYYHVRRTTATICTHAALAAGYIACVAVFYDDVTFSARAQWAAWAVLAACACVWAVALYWSLNNWEQHPAMQSFKYVCTHIIPPAS